MRVLFTDVADSTLVCAFVNEVRYDSDSHTMFLYCAEADFFFEGITKRDYDYCLSKLLVHGYLDLSNCAFEEV